MVFRNYEGNLVALQNSAAGSGQPIELALELDRPEWYKAYLSMESGVFLMLIFGETRLQIRRFFTRIGSI